MVKPNPAFWRKKKVLVTGHTGFKGSWITLWLQKLGATISGISLEPATNPNLFTIANIGDCCNSLICDIRDDKKLAEILKKESPDIVFHLAAQPLVRSSYKDPIETFSTNILGTANILQAIRSSNDTRVAIMITTDKVYQNNEWYWPYKETDRLGGHDPYSASKAASEMVIESFKKSFFTDQNVAVASVRAGNVIGGGDWSEDRLIPDAVRAWELGNPLIIRRPLAKRPWQHVLDPLCGYLILAEKLWQSPELQGAYNFGPQSHEASTVKQLVTLAHASYGKGEIRFEFEENGPHEAGWLALEISKAREILDFEPLFDLKIAIEMTTDWYKGFYAGESPLQLCLNQIDKYETYNS
jgi:CDP-glucose 4,6-dehydratase